MKTFNLTGVVCISVYTEVEANTLEEAINIAKERHVEKYQWSDKEQAKTAWVNDEYDGEVHSITE